MKRLVEEFMMMVENPPKASDTKGDIEKYKERFIDLKKSLLHIASNFFDWDQLLQIKEGLVRQYDEVNSHIKIGSRLEQAINLIFPRAEYMILNMDLDAMNEKKVELTKYLEKICSIMATIEIAETTGLIKKDA